MKSNRVIKETKFIEPITNLLPFELKASFEKLFDYWKEVSQGDDEFAATYAQSVLDRVAHAKEIHEPFTDWTFLDKYKKEIDLLMQPLIPAATTKNEIKAAVLPFHPYPFAYSERFGDILKGSYEEFRFGADKDPNVFYRDACTFILNMLYKTNFDSKTPIVIDVKSENDELSKTYKAFINGDFTSIKPTEKAPKLTPEDIDALLSDDSNLDLWKEKMPPNSYVFEGFAIINLFEITKDEALSNLKAELLAKNALESDAAMVRITQDLRIWLNAPNLNVGLVAFDSERNRFFELYKNAKRSFVLDQLSTCKKDDLLCNMYAQKLIDRHEVYIETDLLNAKNIDRIIIQRLIDKNVRSFILVPLTDGDKTIGLLELTSSNRCELNVTHQPKLNDIIPLFNVALTRSIDERTTQVEALVQKNFTSIHPSVSWRFTEVAEDYLLQKSQGQSINLDDNIRFKDVYPLYGQFDIRGSGRARNRAIQHDLKLQFQYIKEVLRTAIEKEDLPVYQQLIFEVNNCIDQIEDGVFAGDELQLNSFIRDEITPVFNHLYDAKPDLRSIINNYRNRLNPKLGFLYEERKKYENTVTLINDTISAYLETAQENAQQMFPHYFEKYKTDGVEYNIYIGQALLQNKMYHPMYLDNLRLWQLISSVEIIRKTKELQDQMEIPLDIATLILLQDAPLSIQFRMDEKQFDVDGAYNVRYEIVKKRIDKAYLLGGKERLTQPGKISIVYSQDSEIQRSLKHVKYLQQQGMVNEQVEFVALEANQETAGLKALRLNVIVEDQAQVKKRQKRKPSLKAVS